MEQSSYQAPKNFSKEATRRISARGRMAMFSLLVICLVSISMLMMQVLPVSRFRGHFLVWCHVSNPVFTRCLLVIVVFAHLFVRLFLLFFSGGSCTCGCQCDWIGLRKRLYEGGSGCSRCPFGDRDQFPIEAQDAYGSYILSGRAYVWFGFYGADCQKARSLICSHL